MTTARLALRITLLLAALAPSVALADTGESTPSSRMVLGARGPGDGTHALSATFSLPLPQLDLFYVYGINERFTFELDTSIPVIPAGLASAYVGIRSTIFDAGAVAFALRAGASAKLDFVVNSDTYLFAAVQAGALLTFGSEDRRFSIGFDLPWGYQENVGTGVTYAEATLAYEVGAVTGANFDIRVRTILTYEGDTMLVLPLVGFGGSI